MTKHDCFNRCGWDEARVSDVGLAPSTFRGWPTEIRSKWHTLLVGCLWCAEMRACKQREGCEYCLLNPSWMFLCSIISGDSWRVEVGGVSLSVVLSQGQLRSCSACEGHCKVQSKRQTYSSRPSPSCLDLGLEGQGGEDGGRVQRICNE